MLNLAPKAFEVDNTYGNTLATLNTENITGTPWEKVGHPIPQNASIKDVLKAAKLDWEVTRVPLYGHMDNGAQLRAKESFMLIREDNDFVLSPFMGNRYKPVQNETAFEVFMDFVNVGEMHMETAGSLSGGKHIWGLAAINDGFKLADGEEIKGYFLLVQTHKYGYSLRAMFTPIRYPGGHTMVQPINHNMKSRQTYTMPHSRKFNNERIMEIKELLGIAKANMEEFRKTVEMLARTKINEENSVEFLANIFDPGLVTRSRIDNTNLPRSYAEVMDSEDTSRTFKKVISEGTVYAGSTTETCKGTAWGLYNTVLNSYDKVLGRSVDTRLETSWLGQNATKKTDAFNKIKTLSQNS